MRTLPLITAVSALALTGTALAADATAPEVSGKAGVRIVQPPEQVAAGEHNVPVGVRFTAASERAKVRAVVVTIRKPGAQNGIHYGKQVFKPTGSHGLERRAITIHAGRSYVVRYQVLSGPVGADSHRAKVEFPVKAG
jgi:hypothetical protein